MSTLSKNTLDNESRKFVECPTGQVAVATCDSITHDKLDALGGTSNTTSTIYNIAAATSGTEYSQALPANCKKFILRSRSKGTIQLAYTSGQSGTTYITLNPGAVFEDANFYTSQTIYFQSSKNSDTLELLAFS